MRIAQNPQTPVRAAAAFVVTALVAVAVAGTADARLLKRLDYDSGNFRQWGAKQAVAGGAKIVRTWHQGRYGARFVVRPGDDPIGASGERAEVWSYTNERAGKSSWWKWSTFFPKNFQTGRHWWNIFTQWHHSGLSCESPVQFVVDYYGNRPRLRLLVNGGQLNGCSPSSRRAYSLGPLRRGRWITFVFHVRWSPYKSRGFVAVWRNGRKVLPFKRVPTLYAGTFVYVKQGYYRAPTPWTNTVFHDGLRRYDRRPSSFRY